MNKIVYALFASLTLIALCFGSCQKFDALDDLEASDRDSEFAIPLFSTSLSFRDILAEFDTTANITIDPDGAIFLNYKGNVAARTSSDIFEIASEFDGFPLPILDTLSALPFEVPNGIDLDFAILKTGTFRYVWQSHHEEKIKVVFSFPNVIAPDGKIFTDTITAPYGGAVPITYPSPIFDLSGYTVRPEEDSLYVHYEVFKQSGEKDTLTSLFIIINDFNASYVEGYLGNDIYELERDTIEIGFLGNWTGKEFYFADPRLRMTIHNSFGFPVRSKANLVNILTLDDNILPLRSDFLQTGIDFEYPTLDEVGETKITVFDFNKDNSNIDSVLAVGPRAVDYDLEAIPNPDLDTTVRGFMTDTSMFMVQVEVELPVYGRSTGFAVRDTLNLDFAEYTTIQEAEFKLITDNEMPMDIDLQVFFANADGSILDSLFLDGRPIVGSALVDDDGNVQDPTSKTHFIPVNKARMDRIRETEQVFLNARFSTFEQGQLSVTLLADQAVKMRMGMRAKIN